MHFTEIKEKPNEICPTTASILYTFSDLYHVDSQMDTRFVYRCSRVWRNIYKCICKSIYKCILKRINNSWLKRSIWFN